MAAEYLAALSTRLRYHVSELIDTECVVWVEDDIARALRGEGSRRLTVNLLRLCQLSEESAVTKRTPPDPRMPE